MRLDHRELYLKDNLSLDFECCNLLVGDIEISNGEYVWLFERKSVSDLYNSIIDGRYHEQKQRLMNGVTDFLVTYIIEGVDRWCCPWSDARCVQGKVKDMIVSAILNLQYRDHVRVVFTKDAKDTCDFLECFFQRVSKNKFDHKDMTAARSYVPTVKTKKKDNIDSKVCLSLQLACIPGISLKIANKVMDGLEVRTMNDLLVRLKDSPNAKQMLCSVPGIGKALAHQILTYMGL